MTSDCGTCPAAAYLGRPAEGLTVNGYRNWVAGIMTQDHAHFTASAQRFVKIMGYDGHLASKALGEVVKMMGDCALCPLKCFAPDVNHLGTDECMLLGLIASIQHGDDAALEASARALTCPQNFENIISPAGEYAAIMKAFGSLLLPIPASVLSDIHLNPQLPRQNSNYTLH